MPRYFIVGGAGFIGSHLAARLLEDRENDVVVFDNFSSGRYRHLEAIGSNNKLKVIAGDAKEPEQLQEAMQGADIVYHLAANPDIAKAMTQPGIDFWEGTYLTQNVLEAMRINGVKRILYASGSGVYGDLGSKPAVEDHAPMLPVSTYGASKLACEALICSYAHLFDIHGASFRFANVVGPRQTHGVAYDFIRSLTENPAVLPVMGDGLQSKSYIYVGDVIAAMFLVENLQWNGFCYYNVATSDYVTVREIAGLVVETMGLEDVKYRYSGGIRGWKGDVPVVRFNTGKIRNLGWSNKYSSKEALQMSITAMVQAACANGPFNNY